MQSNSSPCIAHCADWDKLRFDGPSVADPSCAPADGLFDAAPTKRDEPQPAPPSVRWRRARPRPWPRRCLGHGRGTGRSAAALIHNEGCSVDVVENSLATEDYPQFLGQARGVPAGTAGGDRQLPRRHACLPPPLHPPVAQIKMRQNCLGDDLLGQLVTRQPALARVAEISRLVLSAGFDAARASPCP